MTADVRYCRATTDTIREFINRLATYCGQPLEWRAHDSKTPTLIVECATIGDARMWSLAFCADLGHWREADLVDIQRRVASSFASWFGWHVMIHASEPLNVPAVAELVAL